MKVKKVYKYATGKPIPEGAVYLNTVKQEWIWWPGDKKWQRCWFVWHYFLVEVDDHEKS